ncbi:cuticle protein 19 [Cryptotermes secundus]|uniref:cuticle protein 19 n=1 Tax=Cryptotermes secundus TaxID=105785 RepID=UPI000CD7C954|nr:cuticle protein 19 [Cryptotermes secundus]
MVSFEVAVIFGMLLVISFAQHHQELPQYAAVPLEYHHGEVEVEEHHHAHPKYEFKYGVKDTHTHDIKEQAEKRDGHKVEGYYKLLEADGTTRTVHYTADKHTGFHAQVVRSGHAIHPIHQHH